MGVRYVNTEKGRCIACGCGKPLTGKLAYVTLGEGRYDGQTMLCHMDCIQPAPKEAA